MLLYYSLKTLVNYLDAAPELSYRDFVADMEAGPEKRVDDWVSLGGQIAPAFKVDKLRERIRNMEMKSWDDIHAVYDEMAAAYTLDKAQHAWAVYRLLDRFPASKDHPLADSGNFKKELETLSGIYRTIEEHVYISRAKDFEGAFRGITFRNKKEMEQVLGTVDTNPFVKIVRERTRVAEEALKKIRERL